MSTNYLATFIEVAEDCPASVGEIPTAKGDKPTVASMQYEMLVNHPYQFTSDDVLFEIHAQRQEIPDGERESARELFFSKGQACLRASPLGKRYGWGTHHDTEGKVALIPLGSPEYAVLREDPALDHVKAMRSKRG